MGYDVEILNLEELQSEWERGCEDFVADIRTAVADTLTVTTKAARDFAPKKSGALAKSIKPTFRANKNGASGKVTVGADHAEYVVNGTEPHPIFPKGAGEVDGVLRFEVGGSPVFARYVLNHPGTKPNDFLALPTDIGQATLENETNHAVERLKRRISG